MIAVIWPTGGGFPWVIGALVGTLDDGALVGADVGGTSVGAVDGDALVGGAGVGVSKFEFANVFLVLDKIYELYPQHAKDETISIHSRSVKFFILPTWRTFAVSSLRSYSDLQKY